MTDPAAQPFADAFEPKRPTLAATALLSLWVAILSLPAWTGQFLAGPFSDQYDTGYAFRDWLASEVRRTGRIPLWNPELFGGLPFVGAMHGDIFYPTAWLRLILPTATAMNLGFAVHYVLAGLFMYLLLRSLRTSWTAAVAGGFAYQLSGVIGSYVQPGHDGKLFVTSLLPLALLGLVRALRDRQLSGHAVLALAVGLALLSPHAQMTYYLLIAAGLFALYLTFGEPTGEPWPGRVGRLAMSLGAVALGFGIGMIQLLPFFEYLPYSPRAEGYYGFEGSTSYAIPWAHVPEFVLSGFTGRTPAGSYWGPNPLKLHSEYLGLTVVALAVLGAGGSARRRQALWLGGIGGLFLLVALGAATPFYRLWWTVMPFVKQTRAPGMALYVVALVLAAMAAFGVDRLLERDRTSSRGVVWAGVGAGVLLLALAGVPSALAESLAQGVQLAQGRAVVDAARAGAGAIRMGAAASGLALLALGALVFAHGRGRLPGLALALGVPLLVGADLWYNAAPFWTWSPPPRGALYGGDSLTTALAGQPKPLRVLNLPGAYPGSSLMAYRIPQLLGYHGNELHAFDQLAGGKNQWRNLGNPKLWDLYAIRAIVLPAQGGVPDTLPGFVRRGGATVTAGETEVAVFERVQSPDYAWVATAGLKLEDSSAVAAALDPRLDRRSLVLLAEEAPVETPPLETLPPPSPARARVADWAPGRMSIVLDEPPAADAYLVVAENWYPGWRATVDGKPVSTVRANVAQIGVPVSAGSREVELRFESAPYRRGRALTAVSLLGVVALAGLSRVVRRRDG